MEKTTVMQAVIVLIIGVLFLLGGIIQMRWFGSGERLKQFYSEQAAKYNGFSTMNLVTKILIVGLIGLSFTLTGCSIGAGCGPPPGMAADSTGSLMLKVPSGWQVDETGYKNSSLLILGPTESGFTSNIMVISEPTKGRSIDDIEKAQIETAANQHQFACLSKKNITLAGVPARELVYTITSPGRPKIKCKSISAVKNGVYYGLGFATLDSNFNRDQKVFDSAIKSLQWLK